MPFADANTEAHLPVGQAQNSHTEASGIAERLQDDETQELNSLANTEP